MQWTIISTLGSGALFGKIVEKLYEYCLDRHKSRVRALTENAVYVTKTHFDTEFNAMKDVFKCLSDTKLSINAVRPKVDFGAGDTDEVKRKRLAELWAELVASHNKLLIALDCLSAFYPAELYDAAKKCQKAAWLEITQVEHPSFPAFTRDWQLEGHRNIDAYVESYQEARNIIRKRLSHLAVLPLT
ncbi:MAG TPA: hypothetical protein VFK06_04220 [Candidatus Angelobacter sp.]|nr:hypothetical protein [Candidatus Angelobacter sp.]